MPRPTSGPWKPTRRLVRERKIPCEWEDCPAFLYSTQEEDPVRQEAHTAARLGLECSFTLETELPFPVKGAARLEGQARFHPLRFLGALAEELEVFEHSRVIAAEGGALRTERGRVKAEQVVFTTHYPFINVPGLYFLRMHQERSYVLALRGAARLKGMYYGTDPDGVSLRPCGDLLLLGGGKHRHRGKLRRRPLPGGWRSRRSGFFPVRPRRHTGRRRTASA